MLTPRGALVRVPRHISLTGAAALALAGARAGALGGVLAGMLHAQGPALSPAQLDGLRLRTIGPAAMSGRVVDLAVVERDPSTFYVATATGGLWKTTNAGTTYAPVWQRGAVSSLGAVAVHQRDTNVVWIGTGEATNRQSSAWGDGVHRSDDGGRTWRAMGLAATRHVARVVLHPRSTDTVYVAAAGRLWGPNPERGVFRSTDGGRTWERVLFVDDDTGVIELQMDPTDPNTLYAASYQRRRTQYGFHGGGPGSALWRTTDAGRTWTKLARGLPEGEYGRIGISIYRKDPRVVYVTVEQGLQYTASISYAKRLGGVFRSGDRGETWRYMGDWNPRPMYASRLQVDPNDEARIYQVSWSVSSDSGKTFTSPRQSLHGDDRFVWVNPADSRHMIKGDDGGIGISRDRGRTWEYAAALPIAQYYRVAVDMRTPYRVYGGLQDNGSWMGPSATYSTAGIVNDDWVRIGGGDGFFNVPDPGDTNAVYVNSQYLGLTRVDLRTLEARALRPGNPTGEASKKGNWGAPPPRVGTYTAHANWDAPLVASPHDAATLYAGMRLLWKSTDRGQTWTSLGDLTNRVDRRTLRIMGRLPDERTPSLDDGVPYWPTISALAESPLRAGHLWVGTDDGNVQRSTDGGRTFTNVARNVPGLPEGSWIAGLEASRHAAERAYLAVDNHRSDDLRNYLYRTDDGGRTWRSIVGDLPAERSIHTVREDPVNPELLYLGTEMGPYVTVDGGRHWVELVSNLPRVPVYDLVVHPRDGDLVLGTHGRGIWILDDVRPLRELTPAVLASGGAHLFTIRAATQTRLAGTKAHTGDVYYRGENPPNGALVSYWLPAATDTGRVRLTVHDARGEPVATLAPTGRAGVNRVVWNLRHAPLPAPRSGADDEDEGRRAGPVPGPLVVPGTYAVRLTVDGRTSEQRVVVREDPRLRVAPAERAAWTATLQRVGALYARALALVDSADAVGRRVAERGGPTPVVDGVAQGPATGGAAPPAVAEVRATALELTERVLGLYQAIGRHTGRATGEQEAQYASFVRVEAEQRAALARLGGR